MAFKICVVPACTKEEFKKAISHAITPVYLENDWLELHISLIKSKYISKEKGPLILIKNKELNAKLR